MTIHLSVPIFLPLVAGLLGAFAPRRMASSFGVAGVLVTLAYAVVAVFQFDSGQTAVQFTTDEAWISELGIHYQLGIDGLSIWLVMLTAVVWVPATLLAAAREWDQPKLFYFWMGAAETFILGVFCAQDLALFVIFFDLTLVPFYFLIGTWGGRRRVQATTKFVIYTLSGSLLMLAGAVAVGVLATPEGGQISFSFADLAQRNLPAGTEYWIFPLFALAFLIKMPAFPFHGWMPDTYLATPMPVLICLSGVLSKLGAYGFLRVSFDVFHQAPIHFQEILIVIAVVSIVYGSVLAFSQDEARLVVGYSSIAQLGFILLGIFSLNPNGLTGATMQMVNHGLVVAPLFVVIGVLAQRAGGSERLRDLGGAAFRAPLLAALLLIVTLATLAMPGSPNFVGELLILFGAFESKLVYGLVASAGVVLASVYMIRFFQRAMHNRVGPSVDSRDITGSAVDLATIAPLVAAIVALGIYPQVMLEAIKTAFGS